MQRETKDLQGSEAGGITARFLWRMNMSKLHGWT